MYVLKRLASKNLKERWIIAIEEVDVEAANKWQKANPSIEDLTKNPWYIAIFYVPEGPQERKQEQKAEAFVKLLNKYEEVIGRDVLQLDECLDSQIQSAALKRRTL
jgi:hypothetical protein